MSFLASPFDDASHDWTRSSMIVCHPELVSEPRYCEVSRSERNEFSMTRQPVSLSIASISSDDILVIFSNTSQGQKKKSVTI